MTDITKNEFIERIKHYLTIPGDGVYTVHTAKDLKVRLHEKLFGTENPKASWEKSLSSSLPTSNVVLLGIPSDCGGGIQRGANWGPLFLRDSLLTSTEDLNFFDIGDIRVIPHLLDDKYLNHETIHSCRRALYQDEKIRLPVSPLSISYDFAKNFHQHFKSKRIFTIGGDHSISYPIVKAYIEEKKKMGINVAIIHFDAHTDLLEERLGIDLCFGTWASHIIKLLDNPKNFIQVGIRSSGKEKSYWEEKFHHTQYWTDEIKTNGATNIANKIVTQLKGLKVDEVYISFDVDCLDSSYAGATGTPEADGLTPHEPMLIMQEIFENFKITGADIVEIAPMVKAKNIKQIEPETTLMVCQAFSTFLIQAMGAK